MAVVCIRGAITIDKNEKQDIYDATYEMVKQILEQNNIEVEDLISILFTATKDIDQAYPAVAARQLGIVDAALMCVQELYVEGSLKMCIRAAVTTNSNLTQKEVRHIYLKGAKVLRPDLSNK